MMGQAIVTQALKPTANEKNKTPPKKCNRQDIHSKSKNSSMKDRSDVDIRLDLFVEMAAKVSVEITTATIWLLSAPIMRRA
mmetsp:Transcript_18330/g.50053  ORF Transcript_18330/g.50053 Transcript_18330/m.50053 type:complete len:81 (-) Transcript_18330:345-587(-)